MDVSPRRAAAAPLADDRIASSSIPHRSCRSVAIRFAPVPTPRAAPRGCDAARPRTFPFAASRTKTPATAATAMPRGRGTTIVPDRRQDLDETVAGEGLGVPSASTARTSTRYEPDARLRNARCAAGGRTPRRRGVVQSILVTDASQRGDPVRRIDLDGVLTGLHASGATRGLPKGRERLFDAGARTALIKWMAGRSADRDPARSATARSRAEPQGAAAVAQGRSEFSASEAVVSGVALQLFARGRVVDATRVADIDAPVAIAGDGHTRSLVSPCACCTR